jgi:sodium/proline symporter
MGLEIPGGSLMADIITAIIIGLYFVLLIGIGAWGSKKIRTTEDYIVAGRSLGFWVFTILMVASICSGMTLVGVSGLGFASGWSSIWEQLFVPLAAAFCIIVFGVKIHHVGKQAGYMTVEDYFANRFESPRAIRGLSAIAGIVVSAIYLVGQYTAISIVLIWLFNIPRWERCSLPLLLSRCTRLSVACTQFPGQLWSKVGYSFSASFLWHRW